MSYTVLARKYRSRTFADVIGQGPIAATLASAVRTGRIHHGYLFTGTRGSGKTSMARIFAKSLNCLNSAGPTTEPCLECDACVGIAEGQDIDVVEIDAASNTGVDNIRELRSNAAYRPARCRFKIYIIDEVHMLSTGAFNALLKTLEEPPQHVKFILATTEIQKVPATIQSRCQRFNFRHISPEDIAQRLADIVQREGASADPAVLRRVARLANGSMRDALSLLDQLLSISPEKLDADLLDELLPPAQDEQALAVLTAAADGDVARTLEVAEAALSSGRGMDVFISDLIEAARALLLVRACGIENAPVDLPAGAQQSYAELAQRFELSHGVQMIGMLEELRRNARFSSAGRALVDAVLVRIAHLTRWGSIEQLVQQMGGGAPAPRAIASPAVPPVAASPDEKKKNPLGPPSAGGGAGPVERPTPPSTQRSATEPVPTPLTRVTGEPEPRITSGASATPLSRAAQAATASQRADDPALGPAVALEQPDAGFEMDAEPLERRYDDLPEAHASEENGIEAQPPAMPPEPAPAHRRIGVSAEQRQRVAEDPSVQRVLELFEGAEIIDVKQRR